MVDLQMDCSGPSLRNNPCPAGSTPGVPTTSSLLPTVLESSIRFSSQYLSYNFRNLRRKYTYFLITG